MSSSRKDTRQALAALITSEVPAAKAVYRYQKGDWKGVSPIVAITSGGSTRQRKTLQGSFATFTFDVHTFVLHSDKKPILNWTEENAEDLLDDIEQQICTALDANQKTVAWRAIGYADSTSARDTVIIGGATYLHEVIPLLVSVHS